MFFVIGSGRSGTTVLRALLNAHSEVSVPHESDFAIHGYKVVGERALTADDYPLLARIFCDTSEDHGWGWTEEEVAGLLKDGAPRRFQEAVEVISRAFAEREGGGKSVFGIKRPMLIFYAEELQKVFPGCRVVHLVRDGRDVCLSYRQVHKKLSNPFGPKSVFSCALYWQVGLDMLTRLRGESWLLEVRYEDLLEKPRESLASICDHLQIPFEEEKMLGYAREEGAGSVVLEKDKQGHHSNVLKGLMGSNHNKYLSQMAAWERWTFELLAGNGLKRYSYNCHVPSVLYYLAAPVRFVLQRVAGMFNTMRYAKRERGNRERWDRS